MNEIRTHKRDQRLAQLPCGRRLQVVGAAELEVELVDDMRADPDPLGEALGEVLRTQAPGFTLDVAWYAFCGKPFADEQLATKNKPLLL